MRTLVLFALTLALAATGLRAEEAVIRFGVVPLEDKATMFKQFVPLAKYLSKELGVEVKIVVGADYQATMDALGKNDVQFAYLTPTTFPKCEKQNGAAGIRPLARFQEGGHGTYRSCVIVPADSAVTDIAQLKGKKFAFGSKDSTGSHLMPRAALVAKNIDPEKDLAEVKYLGSHTNVADAVALGKFDGGGVKDSVAEKYQKDKKVKILFTSDEIPEFPICTNSKTDAALAEKLVAALLKLKLEDAEAKTILTSINAKYTGCEVAKSEDYNVIRTMIQTLYGEKFYARAE